MALENPPIFEHGFVQGRFIMAVADTRNDPDRYPDLEPMGGIIRIVPLREIHLTGGTEQGAIPTTVTRRPREFNLNDQGYMVDAEAEADPDLKPGVWLAHGMYRVEFNLTPRVNVPSYQILVEPRHTKENPLNLTEQAPIVTPPGYIEVVRAEDRIRAELAAVEAGEALEQARILIQEDTFIAFISDAEAARDEALGIAQTVAGDRLVTEANANSAQDSAISASDFASAAAGSAQSASESATASGEALAELNDQVDQATVQANRAESEAGDAESSAQSAAQSASDAAGSASTASGHAEASEGHAGAALGHSSEAAGHASSASASATEAEAHSATAQGHVEQTGINADRAETAAGEAEGYATTAGRHSTDAEATKSEMQTILDDFVDGGIPDATTEASGLMSASDKTTLDAAPTTEYVDSAVAGVTFENATQTSDGLMSASDKVTLDKAPTSDDVSEAVAGLASESYVDSSTKDVREATLMAEPGTLVRRGNNGAVRIVEPSRGDHAATKDYVDNATSATVLGTSDLNEIDRDGIYLQYANSNASVDLNYPPGMDEAGELRHYNLTSGWAMQIYTSLRDGIAHRYKGTSNWYDWVILPTKAEVDGVASDVDGASHTVNPGELVRRDTVSGSFRMPDPTRSDHPVTRSYLESEIDSQNNLSYMGDLTNGTDVDEITVSGFYRLSSISSSGYSNLPGDISGGNSCILLHIDSGVQNSAVQEVTQGTEKWYREAYIRNSSSSPAWNDWVKVASVAWVNTQISQASRVPEWTIFSSSEYLNGWGPGSREPLRYRVIDGMCQLWGVADYGGTGTPPTGGFLKAPNHILPDDVFQYAAVTGGTSSPPNIVLRANIQRSLSIFAFPTLQDRQSVNNYIEISTQWPVA